MMVGMKLRLHINKRGLTFTAQLSLFFIFNRSRLVTFSFMHKTYKVTELMWSLHGVHVSEVKLQRDHVKVLHLLTSCHCAGGTLGTKLRLSGNCDHPKTDSFCVTTLLKSTTTT